MSPTLLPLVFDAPARGKAPKHWLDLTRDDRAGLADIALPAGFHGVWKG